MIKKFFSCALICLFFSSAAWGGARYSSWPRPFNVPLMTAAELGLIDPDDGVPVRTGQMMIASLASGEMDIACGIGDAAFITAWSRGLPARVIGIASRSPSAFAVVARPEIGTMRELAGKKVGGLRASVVHMVLLSALDEAGLTARDVELFSMPPAEAYAALSRGDVDAALLVGFDIDRARADGMRVLADGTGRVGGLALIVATDRAIADRPDEIRDFMDARRKALDYMRGAPREAAEIAARAADLDIETALRAMDAYDFAIEITSDDVRSLEATAAYLRTNGLAEPPDDLASKIFMDLGRK